MEQTIQKQLEVIEKYINWIHTSLDGEKQKKTYRNIVNYRRKLKKKKFSLEGNPAAAMYGESQVGKSYLISSLLSEEGKPFSITDGTGFVHNFIEEINPIGSDSESTSLVSRFSVNYKPINTSFPVKAILMSPADIILVLCDSYYNDIKADHNLILQTEQINSDLILLNDRLSSRKVEQDIFVEDDVLDIQDYFRENFSTKASNILFSQFFDKVSLLIFKVRPTEWKDIFSLLWNKNEKITRLFSALIIEYQKLNFANTVYLPLESILRKHGTLLDVKRLKEIYETPSKIEQEYKAETTVMFVENGNERNVIFKKSYLCALAAELVFHQQESLLVGKPFLKGTDLLDFPGARSRMTLPENEINDKNIPELLLRGKVAYLFNKYADSGKISIFMLCAKHAQAAQRSMPQMLNNWICKYIGDTPEKRDKFISTSQISPLFIIGTFFNVQLQYDPTSDKPDDLSPLVYRWHQRFESTLSVELLDTETYQWFNNWTIATPNFQNIFLLRDFGKSESPSQLFKGFNENKQEIEEVFPSKYPDFRQKLRQSFLEYDFIRRHFGNPAESWDEAASINKDGTDLIISKLTIAANNINSALREKTLTELNEISQTILTEFLKYFHSNDKDDELRKAKFIAGDIQHKLDFAFSAGGIKLFGKMMKEFMIDEGSVHELYRKKIDDIEHREVVNMDIYSSYRIHVPVEEKDTVDTYFERLCFHYEKSTEEQKQQFRGELEAKNIDLEELISGNPDLIKNNSQQLAEALLEYWFVYLTMNEKHTIQLILAQEGSSALEEITDMFQKLFKKLDIANKIAEKIRRYVDGQNKSDFPFEIVADMSAELLNKCINTVGFEYLDESEVNDLRQANEKNELGLVLDRTETQAENSVADLFVKIDNWTDIIQSNPQEMKSLPSYRNYIAWYDHLKVGFVSVCDIPSYDVIANNKLEMIIKESETIKY